MRSLPLFEFIIKGEGVHCEVWIYCDEQLIGIFTDTGTKYEDRIDWFKVYKAFINDELLPLDKSMYWSGD